MVHRDRSTIILIWLQIGLCKLVCVNPLFSLFPHLSPAPSSFHQMANILASENKLLRMWLMRCLRQAYFYTPTSLIWDIIPQSELALKTTTLSCSWHCDLVILLCRQATRDHTETMKSAWSISSLLAKMELSLQRTPFHKASGWGRTVGLSSGGLSVLTLLGGGCSLHCGMHRFSL